MVENTLWNAMERDHIHCTYETQKDVYKRRKGIYRVPSRSTRSSARPSITITVTDEPGWDHVPLSSRLRRFLKSALRSYGIRCTSITDAPVKGVPTTSGDECTHGQEVLP